MQYVYERGDFRKYYAQIPNIADDELDPYEMRLYVHYKRVAGDGGECYEGIDTTAQKCKMGVSTVRRTRKALAAKGWIELESKGKKGKELVHVTLVDKWDDNYRQYSTSTPTTQTPHPYHTDTRTPTTQTPKEKPYKEKPIKNKENGGGNSSLATDNSSPPPPPTAAVSETDSTAQRPTAQEIATTAIQEHEKTKAQEVREYQARESEILAAFGRLNKAILSSNKGYQPITGTRKLAEQLARRGETEASMKAAWETCKANGIKPMGAFMKWITEGYLPPQQEGHETQVIDGVVCVWVDGQGWMATGGKAQ